jgi:hypothetical protein
VLGDDAVVLPQGCAGGDDGVVVDQDGGRLGAEGDVEGDVPDPAGAAPALNPVGSVSTSRPDRRRGPTRS